MSAATDASSAKNGGSHAASAAQTSAGAPAAAGGGGLKAWLPLIITVLSMPLLAYLTAAFLLVPKLEKATHPAAASPEPAAGEESAPKGSSKEGQTSAGANGRVNYPFGKVLVNVSGSLGTRYLLTSFTLSGTDPSLKNRVDGNKDRLLDLASSTLGAKTIADLEKPGARSLIRAELISVFNTALGGNVVREIYFTEFAIQ